MPARVPGELSRRRRASSIWIAPTRRAPCCLVSSRCTTRWTPRSRRWLLRWSRATCRRGAWRRRRLWSPPTRRPGVRRRFPGQLACSLVPPVLWPAPRVTSAPCVASWRSRPTCSPAWNSPTKPRAPSSTWLGCWPPRTPTPLLPGRDPLTGGSKHWGRGYRRPKQQGCCDPSASHLRRDPIGGGTVRTGARRTHASRTRPHQP